MLEIVPVSFLNMLDGLAQSTTMLIVILLWWFPVFAAALMAGWYLWGVVILSKEFLRTKALTPLRFLIALVLGWVGPFAYLLVLWRIVRSR